MDIFTSIWQNKQDYHKYGLRCVKWIIILHNVYWENPTQCSRTIGFLANALLTVFSDRIIET